MSRPLTALIISVMFFGAGVLELFSLAMILPVLTELFDSDQTAGLAGELTGFLGFSNLSMFDALVLISVFMTVRGLLIMGADFIMAKVARDLEVEVRTNLFTSLLGSTWNYIQSQDLGKMPNLILRETERYSVAIQKLGQFLSAFLIAGVLIISSIVASWKLAILFVIAIIPYFLLTRVLNAKIAKHAQKRIIDANDVSAQTSENLMHLKYIKSSALEGYAIERFKRGVEGYAEHFFKVMCYVRVIKNFPEIFGVLIIACLVFYAYEYMGLESANIVFFLLLMFRGYRQISGVQTIFSALVENIPSYMTCQEFLEESKKNKEIIQTGTVDKQSQTPLKVQNVTHFYNSRENPALKNVNIEFPDKGLVVFAGQSGAGKTTLADLILGLVVPQEGDVYLNGNQTLTNVSMNQWRQEIGYVPQDPFLISGSIKDNILLHSRETPMEELIKVAKLAKIHDFIESLPEKYDTSIGFINTGISGGQKQRIALARALVKNPKLLILDEATSALDPQTERDIRVVIKDIAQSKLVLMIAHNPDMVKEADIICLMDNGEVVAYGPYKELSANNSAFQSYIANF